MKAFLLEAPAGLSFQHAHWPSSSWRGREMRAQAEPMDPAGCPGEVGFWIGDS